MAISTFYPNYGRTVRMLLRPPKKETSKSPSRQTSYFNIIRVAGADPDLCHKNSLIKVSGSPHTAVPSRQTTCMVNKPVCFKYSCFHYQVKPISIQQDDSDSKWRLQTVC